MGWWLTAADTPAGTDGSTQSITVALIVTLGTVLVALLTLVGQWLTRSARTSPSPPAADSKLGETVAVLADHDETDRRTLAVLDRHVDQLGDAVDRLRWEMDDMKAWRDQHARRHGQP